MLMVALSALVALSHAAPIQDRFAPINYRFDEVQLTRAVEPKTIANVTTSFAARLVSTWNFTSNQMCPQVGGSPTFCYGVPNWPCNVTLLPGSVGQLTGVNQTGNTLTNQRTSADGILAAFVSSSGPGWSNITYSTSGLRTDSSPTSVNQSTASGRTNIQWGDFYQVLIEPAGQVTSVVSDDG